MLKPISRNAFSIHGPKHTQGGVPLGGAEVEGGETVHFTRPGTKGYVFSDAFGYAGKTFAQHHKALAKRNASPIEIAKLAQTQERNRPMIQKNGKYALGGLLSTAARIGGSALPYAGPALTFGMGLLSKDRTPKATKVKRTALNDLRNMETDINVDPALEQGSNAYRAFQQSSGSNPSVALAGYTANLRNRSGLMAGREAARTELVNKRQGAMAEANMNYDNQDAQYAEQARQDRMMSQASRTNFLTEGLTGMSGAYTNDMNNAIGLAATLASVNSPKVLSDMTSALYQTNMSGAAGRMIRGMVGNSIDDATRVTPNNTPMAKVNRKFSFNNSGSAFNKYGGLLGPIQRKLGGPLSEDPNAPPMSYADSQQAGLDRAQTLATARTANTMNPGGFRPMAPMAPAVAALPPDPQPAVQPTTQPVNRDAEIARQLAANRLPNPKPIGVFSDSNTALRSIVNRGMDREAPPARGGTPAPTPATSAAPANYDSMSFGQAFRAARGANAGTFQWKGKSYTTQVAGQGGGATGAKATVTTPVASPAPPTSRNTDVRNSFDGGKPQILPNGRNVVPNRVPAGVAAPQGLPRSVARPMTPTAPLFKPTASVNSDQARIDRTAQATKARSTPSYPQGTPTRLAKPANTPVDLSPSAAIMNRTRNLPQVVVTGQRANTTSRRAAPTRRSYTNETGRGTISTRTRSRRTD
jgi:hypothetical protein